MRTTRAILDEMRLLRDDLLGVQTSSLEQIRLLRDDLLDVRKSSLESSRRQETALAELTGAVRDLRDESRAHTRAIFALIDSLEGGTATG